MQPLYNTIWASTRQNQSSGFLTKRNSKQSPQLQTSYKLKFLLWQVYFPKGKQPRCWSVWEDRQPCLRLPGSPNPLKTGFLASGPICLRSIGSDCVIVNCVIKGQLFYKGNRWVRKHLQFYAQTICLSKPVPIWTCPKDWSKYSRLNTHTHGGLRERSGSVVECLTRDRGAADSSLTGVTALWSLSKTHLS